MFALPLSSTAGMPPNGPCYGVDFEMLSHNDSKDFFNKEFTLQQNQHQLQQQPESNLAFGSRDSTIQQDNTIQQHSSAFQLFPTMQHQSIGPQYMQESHNTKYFSPQVQSPGINHQINPTPYSYFPASPVKPKLESTPTGNTNAYLAYLNRQRKAPTKVPSEMKSDSYWKRRNKNNHSAKKSRDKKRQEEKRLMQDFCILSEDLYKDLLAYFTLQKAKDLIGGPEIRRRRAAELPYVDEIQQFYYYEGLLFGLKEANKNRGLPLRALIPWKQCYEDLNMWTDRRFVTYVNSEQLSSSNDATYFPANFPAPSAPSADY